MRLLGGEQTHREVGRCLGSTCAERSDRQTSGVALNSCATLSQKLRTACAPIFDTNDPYISGHGGIMRRYCLGEWDLVPTLTSIFISFMTRGFPPQAT